MDIDDIYNQIGESGPQQIKYGVALCLIKIYTPFLILQYTFVARQTSFICSRNGEELMNECFDDSFSTCDNITYTEDTIVSEWNLVCDRNWMAKATMSTLMMGFMLGAFVLGNLADRIGRKSNLLLCLSGCIFFNAVSSITTSYSVYIGARFFVGVFVAGQVLSIVVLASELVGAGYRGMYGLAIMGSFPLGIMLLALVAFNHQGWRSLTNLVTMAGIPFLLYNWYLVESPRWLLNAKRISEAQDVLAVIAKGNGASTKCIQTLKASPASSKPTESLLDMFGRRKLVICVYILAYNWFVNGASYYGLTLASGTIGTDLYTGFALSGLVELPAVVFCYLAIERYGRRIGLAASMIGSGLACILIHFLSDGPLAFLATSSALFGKMCIAGSFKIAYIMTGEIFATSIRNSGLGMMSGTARVGSILAPFIVMAGESWPGIQFTIFGVLGISGGILSLWLPETKGKPLPETISEMLLDRTKKISIHV